MTIYTKETTGYRCEKEIGKYFWSNTCFEKKIQAKQTPDNFTESTGDPDE
jgi:hypothetical protein